MKRLPVTLLAMFTVLGPGRAWCTTEAGAIPAGHTASGSTELSVFDVRAAGPARPYVQVLAPAHVPPRQSDITTQRSNCRHDVAGASGTTGVAGKTCDHVLDTRSRFSVQFGRRLGAGSDLLGEFDGVRLDILARDGLRLQGIAGYRDLATAEATSPAGQVYGISAATQSSARSWDLGSYFLEQQLNGQVTGRSTGGAFRFLQPGRSMLFFADYDAADNAWGTVMTSGAWQFPFRTTLSATLDLQQRPLPGRLQRYLQDSMTVTEGWDWVLPTDLISGYTGDGSRTLSVLAGSLSHALSSQLKLRGDVVVLDAADHTVSTTPDRSSESHYHLKFSGKDLFLAGDRSELDVQRSFTDDGRTDTATLRTEYPFRRFWNLVSLLRVDYFRPAAGNGSRTVASPTVIMAYRPNRQFDFHIEAGGNLFDGEVPAIDRSSTSCFVSLGYRLNL